MKKLIKYILIVLIVVVAMPSKHTTLTKLLDEFSFSNAVTTYYTTSKKEIENAVEIKNGGSYLYQCSFNQKECERIEKELDNLDGQSVSFDGNYEYYIFLKNKLCSSIYLNEEISQVKTCYGYNNKLTNSVNIDNHIINIQLAFNNNVITIGNPVILGSY